MKIENIFISRSERFSVGQEMESGRYCLSFPVYNGLVEYSEYYELTPDEFERFTNGKDDLRQLLSECKERLHDDRLMQQPGRKRGYPC